MKTTYSWLKELSGTTLTIHEIADRLTMLGLEVEGIAPLEPAFSGVIVGELLEIRPIPNSSHLRLCQVSTGSQRMQVVCGASNIKIGQKVAFAPVGAQLPGDITITEAAIMGQKSHGMICSEAELGVSNDAAGIMVLDNGYAVGSDLNKLLQTDDSVIEFSVTPNRPDCLGVMGIAREIAVSENRRFSFSRESTQPPAGNASVEVSIQNLDACPRYTARLIKNVKIGPSPKWLVDRLWAAGMRSISNVVDVTNYIMLETGQPLHAFDYDNLIEGKIIVRDADPGEEFITLDDKLHKLQANHLLICDGKRPVAIGGIMGGLNSEVSENTKNLLLECAYFAPIPLRKTAKQLGISTESSRRFERGVDPNALDWISDRATRMILQLAGGEVASPLIDVYPSQIAAVEIPFRLGRASKVIGTEIAAETAKNILVSLECHVDASTDPWRVFAPTFRPDLTREIDLIEEVARVFGYNNIPNKTRDTVDIMQRPNEFDDFIDSMRTLAVATGLSEVVTISMVSKKLASTFVESADALVELVNPLSEDMAVLRPSMFSSILPVVAFNLNRKQVDIRFFEVGSVFSLDPHGDISENKQFAAVFTGNQQPHSWRAKAGALDMFDIKGEIQFLLQRLHIPEVNFHDSAPRHVFDYGLVVRSRDVALGRVGMLKKTVLDHFNIERDILAFELDLSLLFATSSKTRQFTEIPKFPSIDRDIAIVVDDQYSAETIRLEIVKYAGPLLVHITIFDYYKGKQVPPGKKSLAFALSFQSQERTLRESEVDEWIEKILSGLNQKFDAVLRQ